MIDLCSLTQEMVVPVEQFPRSTTNEWSPIFVGDMIRNDSYWAPDNYAARLSKPPRCNYTLINITTYIIRGHSPSSRYVLLLCKWYVNLKRYFGINVQIFWKFVEFTCPWWLTKQGFQHSDTSLFRRCREFLLKVIDILVVWIVSHIDWVLYLFLNSSGTSNIFAKLYEVQRKFI